MPVLPMQVTYDGYFLDTVSSGLVRISIRIVSGLHNGLSVRGSDTVVPSAAGVVPRSRVAHTRIIELEGWIAGVGTNEADQREDAIDIMHDLEALFHPTKGEETLSVVRMDGSTKTIEARPMDDLLWGDDTIPTFRTISVSLLASSDPYWSPLGS